MNRDKLEEALSQISDKHVQEAAKPRRSKLRWAAPIAAVLALVILVTAIAWPFAPKPESPELSFSAPTQGIASPEETTPIVRPVDLAHGRVAAPVYPKMAAYPGIDESGYDAWSESRAAQYNQPKGYAKGTKNFFSSSIQEMLDGSSEGNAVCSPVNVYMALAMLAETAGGQTRQEILDLLGASSIETLRTQAGHVWNAHYCDDNATTLKLANSLWLADWLSYNQATADILAEDYYASVYHSDFAALQTQEILQGWLNEQTGGLLSEQVQNITLDPTLAMVLASTVYYRARWADEFREERNTQDVFHAPTGDTTVTYMHRNWSTQGYYWGKNFGAVQLSLDDGGTMWLILPDEGYAPADILPQATKLALTDRSALSDYPNQRRLRLNLSLPKFDITADLELSGNLQSLGITHAFDPDQADFTGISKDSMYLDEVKHAARVTIDEEGIVAAAYTMMQLAGAAQPPDEVIDFTLDRPFLFFITSRDSLPLFAGVVNQP